MKIALAQIKTYRGDLAKNLLHHQKSIGEAASKGSDLIVFPELSLTGYEPILAKDLALHPDDKCLEIFQTLSNSYNLTIGVGLPIKGEVGILISLIFFQPYMHQKVYYKQHLHIDELPYFVPGEDQYYIHLKGLNLFPAICYESLLPEHAESAAKNGADLYLASVAKPGQGVDKGFIHYPNIARKYGIWVMMVNSIGPCDDFVAHGNTSAWNKNGELIGKLDNSREGLLIIDTELGERIP